MSRSNDEYYGWKVHKPEWENYPKWICTKKHYWSGIYGNAFFISGKDRIVDRIMFDYPNIAEHFYFLYWETMMRPDIIFGSYDLDEVKRFIEYYGIKYYRIYDAVNKKVIMWR